MIRNYKVLVSFLLPSLQVAKLELSKILGICTPLLGGLLVEVTYGILKFYKGTMPYFLNLLVC